MEKELKAPSQKQIKFANKIAKGLKLDFPRGDYDFTAIAFYYFIDAHIDEYKRKFPRPKYTRHYYKRSRYELHDSEDATWGYDYGMWEY